MKIAKSDLDKIASSLMEHLGIDEEIESLIRMDHIGRGYRRPSLGVVTDRPSVVSLLLMAILIHDMQGDYAASLFDGDAVLDQDLLEAYVGLSDRAQVDSMGYSTIHYWPFIQVTD